MESVLLNVENLIAEMEEEKEKRIKNTEEKYKNCSTWYKRQRINEAKRMRTLIRPVCLKLSIFDWWIDYISLSQLKQMKNFLITAGKLGFNGYVCFKVGSVGCSHGMWAYKKESTDGYSPDGECLHHSFVSNENYWDYRNENEKWMGDDDRNEHGRRNRYKFTLKEVKQELAI